MNHDNNIMVVGKYPVMSIRITNIVTICVLCFRLLICKNVYLPIKLNNGRQHVWC